MEMPVRQPQRGLMFAKRGPVSARVNARVTTTALEVITASLQEVAAVRGSANHALNSVSPCGTLSVDVMEEPMEMPVRQLRPVYLFLEAECAFPSETLRTGALRLTPPKIFLRTPRLSERHRGFPAHPRRAFVCFP